jgi:predicted glycosyltransferase
MDFPFSIKSITETYPTCKLFKDMVLRLQHRDIKPIILDRGMLSIENLKTLLNLKLKVIAGMRKTKELQQKFLFNLHRETIYTLRNRVKLKNT